MRHVAVRRVTVLLGTGFVLYAAVFAWFVRDEPDASATSAQSIADGALLFQRHCAACHAVDDLRPQVRDDGTKTRSALETFLRDHAGATDAEDRLILDYLSSPEAP